ncbi:abortive infection family protein [Streptomyces sp. NPDC058217]|uniref:abortive infection family protein n=1 Tax=Streptomyces sp. NPDC058217 TaxID=3346384 RepID=UPI0036EA25D6
MTHLYQDPFKEPDEAARRITPVTRRDLFDHIRSLPSPWHGRLEEVEFLARLYDLEALHSEDRRFDTFREDIVQHRYNNYDWDDYWVFTDPRLQLTSGPDERLLGFLAQMVHPVVCTDRDQAASTVDEFNQLLAPDGWVLKQIRQLSGRPVYAPALTGSPPATAVGYAHEVAARIDAEYIAQQVTRMEGAVELEPELAIGTAKEFLESICKTVLDERQVLHDKNDDLLVLLRKTTRCLRLTPDHLESSAAAATIKRMMMSLGQIGQGAAELRNGYGTGHGRSKAQASQRLTSRHARLVVGSASALGVFLYETHEEGGAPVEGPGL